MAKSKKELQEQLQAQGVDFNPKHTVAEFQELVVANQATTAAVEDSAVAAALNNAVAEGPAAKTETSNPDKTPEQTAKAGKRSNKALREAAEKEAKEERKALGELVDVTARPPSKPARSRLERRGKHFRKSAKLIEIGKLYSLEQAVELAQKTSHVKFDATVELHVNLGVDPRQADQNIRDNVVLPAGTGKKVRIAVLSEDAGAAKSAGADIAGADDLFAELDKGNFNFDILIAAPSLMPRLGKYARVLGPKGLMPNPKSGTVTPDVERAIAEAKAGRVEYRVDTTGIIHLGVGKVSFTPSQLLQNVQAVLASIKNNKPTSSKGNYFKAVHLTTSMGPSVSIELTGIS